MSKYVQVTHLVCSSNHVLVNDCNASRVRQCAHCHVRDAINGGPHGRMCSMECRREHQEEKERKVQEEEEEEEERSGGMFHEAAKNLPSAAALR